MTWMTKTCLMLAGVVAAGAVHASVPQTEAGDNPYNVFVIRNPFNIRPAPVQTNAPEPEVEAPPKIEVKLTGITFFGKRRAYFQATEQGTQKAEPQYWVMEEEEERDGLKVLEIDEVNSKVRVRQEGAESLMSFLTHGIAAPAASGGAAVPGAPGVATPGGVVRPQVGYGGSIVPVPGVAPANRGGLRTIPSRSPRIQPIQSGVLANPALSERYGFGSGQSSLPVVRAPETPAHNLTTEEQVLLMELQKVSQPNAVLPPTPGLPSTTQTPGGPGVPSPFPPPPALPGVPNRAR